MKLAEVAAGISRHLARWEADPKINKRHGGPMGTRDYFNANAVSAGSRVFVRYVSYQHAGSLTKADAEGYLAWMDAGNVGTHYEWARATGNVRP